MVSSTAAPRPVLTVPLLQAAIKARHWRPLFLVDLAVPRDIEEGAGKIENVYPYDVDDLAHVVQGGKQARETCFWLPHRRRGTALPLEGS